jgi:hypothetical protein
MVMRGPVCCMLEQDRLEENLIDPVRRLRRRPVAVGAVGVGEAVAAAGDFDSRQLLAGEGRAVADVVRIIRRQAGIADLVGNAEPAEDFHGARGDMIALRLGRLGAGAHLHDGHRNAAPGKIDRKRQSDRACAHDQHIGTGHSSSAPDFLTMSAQRSTSVLMKAAKLSGVDPGNVSSASVVSLPLVSGSESSLAI